MQVEDRSADLLDDFLQVVDAARESLFHFGCARSRDRPLQREPDREQPLYDVVVEVAGDAVTIGQDAQLAHLALGAGQLPRQRRLVGEGGHHVELVVGERLRTGMPQGHQHTGDRVGGAQAAAPAPDRSPSRRRVEVEPVESSGQCAARTPHRSRFPRPGSCARPSAGPSPAVAATTSSVVSLDRQLGVSGHGHERQSRHR